MAVFPKVDAASPRGLMAPPGLRPWAPKVLSGIGSAFGTGSPGSALGSYVVSLCAYPTWDTQVSRSWPLACPIRGLPFSRLTDWGGTAPCGANINAACRRSPFGGWRHHLARWEACHWILSCPRAPYSTAITDSLDSQVASAPLRIQFAGVTPCNGPRNLDHEFYI